MSGGTTRLAAVDIGSNSTNLLIVEHGPGDPRVLHRIVTTTRLGTGLESTGRLSEDAVRRTLDTLASYAELMRREDVRASRVVACNACRVADNTAEFVDRVRATTGLVIDVLPALEEGRLAYIGARSGLRPDPMGDLMIDIGGGSTELVLGDSGPDGNTTVTVHSIDVGAVRLTDRHLNGPDGPIDPPRPEDLANAIGDVADLVDDVLRRHPEIGGRRRVIGIAGTIDTVAAVEIGDERVDRHGFELTRAAVEDVFRTLATEPLRDRVHNPGLPADRADVIVGGCCALVAVMRRLRIESLTVSTRNILDGICAELSNPDHG